MRCVQQHNNYSVLFECAVINNVRLTGSMFRPYHGALAFMCVWNI